MVVSKTWTLAKEFNGLPKLSDFLLKRETLPDSLKDGEILLEALYLSVDPYMRAYKEALKRGQTIIGQQVAKVVASKSSKYPVGTLLLANPGWRSHSIFHESDQNLLPVPPLGNQPLSTALGVLGMPGATAYFGFLEICQPKEGEVVLVNGAAGAVGSIVGQIAKIKGCTVIGFAGTSEKVAWLKKLGFDFAFNYRDVDVTDVIKRAAPDGIDCYFDNVGGEFTNKVFPLMKQFGRISVCGVISSYNQETPPPIIPHLFHIIVRQQLHVEGFLFSRWMKEFPRAFEDLAKWIHEGKLKYEETMTEGFENMPQAFISMLKGGNTGKAVVKA